MTILLCFGIIVVAILLMVIFQKDNTEQFYGGINSATNIQDSMTDQDGLVSIVNGDNSFNSCPSLDDYVKKTNIGLAAKAAALEYCPVDPDYDASLYIKKTEIKNQQDNECPKQPDMKDYVLKSTIPPQQGCPACVCPKVEVSANMCKKCPTLDKSLCPKQEPCTAAQCSKVVQCYPNQKTCPLTAVCPAPKACPTQPTQVCPAIKIEKQKCPAPNACPSPPPCPQVQRCEQVQAPSCKYYGIKNVYTAQDLLEELNGLIDSSDPQKQALLAQAKTLVNTKLSQLEEQQLIATQQSQISSLKNQLAIDEQQLQQNDSQINLNSNEPGMNNYLHVTNAVSKCNRDQELIDLNLN